MPPEHRDEYRQLSTETLEWMLHEVRKHHDEILVMKTQRQIFGFIGGAISGAAIELVLKFAFHL